MAKRGRPRKNGWDELLACWRSTWEMTAMTTPLPLEVDKALAALGSSTHAVKIECARIAGIPEAKRTKSELAMAAFWARCHSAQEAVLQQRLMEHPAGQIHIAKALHGMIPKERLEISDSRSLEDVLNGHT